MAKRREIRNGTAEFLILVAFTLIYIEKSKSKHEDGNLFLVYFFHVTLANFADIVWQYGEILLILQVDLFNF